jgi:methionyl-tRNA formyltransferase
VRLVYIGTSGFALDVLVASGLEPALVVTRPPAPRGRGRRLAATPVAIGARERGLEVLEPAQLEEAAAQIAAVAPDLLILCAYGALVREPLLSDHEILNIHPSLLPRWRGAAPIERAIMAGDERTGVSLMRVVAELDAGPVCAAVATPIDLDDDYGTLAARLAALAGPLLAAAVAAPRCYLAQASAGVSYADKIGPADRALDPARPAAALERAVRALQPHIGCRLPNGLGVLRAHLAGGPALEPGALVADAGRLFFGASPGTLELLVVRPAGGRPMEASAFLRGHGTL